MECPTEPSVGGVTDNGMPHPLTKTDTDASFNANVVDHSEDSGLSSISDDSRSSTALSTNGEQQSTIGEGISFVDPKLIEEEMRKKEAKKEARQKKNLELQAEKLRAQEAYDQEVQEKQYKCLMHLLSQSKVLTTFFNEKINLPKDEKNKEKRTKPKTPAAASSRASVSKKKGKGRSSKAGVNVVLSEEEEEEEVSEEQASTSDEDERKKDEEGVKNFKLSKYFNGNLRDYQKLGVNWLKALFEHGLNGILADEMGLGKTVQVIAFTAYLIEKKIPGPYMVLVPLSTLPNWTAEFQRFAPALPVITFYGNKEERQRIKKDINKKYDVDESISTYPIVVMTYETVRYEQEFVKKFSWKYIVIDEAQRIKNYNCQLIKILKSCKSINRLLLTGTPLQNDLSELWSLLNFLLPDIFDNLEAFEAWFDAKDVQGSEGQKKFLKREQEKQVMSTLREILKPFMLRRLKEHVCPDVPPSKEVIVYTPLTNFQYNLYKAIIAKDLEKFKEQPDKIVVYEDGARPKRKCTLKPAMFYRTGLTPTKPGKSLDQSYQAPPDDNPEDNIRSFWGKFITVTDENINFLSSLNFANTPMMYRHIINHPYLIHRPLDDCGLGLINDDLIKVSGKLLVLDIMLKKLKANGHKVLIFSNMKMVLDIIEDYLSMRTYKHVRLDGDIKYEDRRKMIEEFQTDPELFLFLLTTKAGGVGLNLAAADTVIFYDSDWNPQNDLQAMARCHRIGQKRPVVVYRFCTKGTIDEEIIKRANTKRFLEKAVISTEGSLFNSENGLLKLKQLLDEEACLLADFKSEVYTEAELEELLDRSDMLPEKLNALNLTRK